MGRWQTKTLEDFLAPYRIEHIVQDDQPYRQVTISKNHGISFRGVKYGRNIGRKRQFVIDLKKHPNTVLFTRQGVLEGAIGIAPNEVDKSIVTENMPMMSVNTDIIEIEYLKKLLVSEYLFKKIRELKVVGSAQKSIHERDILQIKIKLPNKEQQLEICAKFNTLDNEHSELEFEITHQQSLLKKLRQSILQDAISGKLTEKWRKDNPDVEPATELLARIKAEKERLVKEKKIKKQKPLSPVGEDEVPFELPEGWIWCRLGDFLITYVDCPHSTPKYKNDGYICLRSNNITEKGLDLANAKYVDYEEYKYRISRLVPQMNDVLYIREGGRLGVSCILKSNNELCLGQRMMLFRLQDNICSEYLNVLLHSPMILGYVKKLILGAASPRINVKDIINFPVPVLPELEMREVVNKLDVSNTMLNELEHQTSKTQQHSELLMQAVLQEAFGKN